MMKLFVMENVNINKLSNKDSSIFQQDFFLWASESYQYHL